MTFAFATAFLKVETLRMRRRLRRRFARVPVSTLYAGGGGGRGIKQITVLFLKLRFENTEN